MPEVIQIHPPEIRGITEGKEVSARIQIGETTQRLWFRLPEDIPCDTRLDAFVICLLPTAMNLNADLIAEGDLSAGLEQGIERFQRIFKRWYPSFHQITLRGYSSLRDQNALDGRRTGSFFSGGLDSFHTILRNAHRVDDVILIRGFDISLDNPFLWERVRSRLREAAEDIRKPLIEVSTNSRNITEPYVSWPRHQYGCALASIGHLLARHQQRVLIPASDMYETLIPWGSHPLTDPLLGSERFAIEHEGADCSRYEKVLFVSGYPTAMKHLRVCWHNSDNAYNCGICEKCTRTQLEFLAAGVMDRYSVFPTPLTVERVRNLRIPDTFEVYYENILDGLKKRSSAPEFAETLELVLKCHKQKQLGEQWSRHPPDLDQPAIRESLLQQEEFLLSLLLSKGKRHFFRLGFRNLKRGRNPQHAKT